MSFGLVTRAINAPMGVSQSNRFARTRTYLPLSQFFLRQGGVEADSKKVLTGKEAPAKGPPTSKKKKGKTKSEELTERRKRGEMKVAKPQKCHYCDEQATKAVIHSNAYAYTPVCKDHFGKAKKDVGDEFCYTQRIMQKGETCELCDRPATFLVYSSAFNASKKPIGGIVKGACKGHLEQVRGQVNNDPTASRYTEPIVKRLKQEDITEGKQCRYCRKGATSSEGGIPCCDAHKALATRAARKKAEEKGKPFALLFNEAKKYPEFGRWRLLGIDDEVETCENCGKKGLKRTMVLEPVDGGGIIHVGTTCGELLTGRNGSWLMQRAQKVQAEKEHSSASAARSDIIKRLVSSRFWKLHHNLWGRYFGGAVKGGHPLDEHEVKTLRKMMTNLLNDTGLDSETVKRYFKGKMASTTHRHIDDWYAIALGQREEQVPKDEAFTVYKSGAAGPSAGMTGSGNIPAVALPIGAGDGGWDAIDGPGSRKKKRKKKKGVSLSTEIGHLLRQLW